jgi:uncharacterized protein YdhG (YjbR/CyaY superfamily)
VIVSAKDPNHMSAPRFANIEDFLASLDPVKAKTARAIIDAILVEFPETEAKIAWNVPHITLGKQYVFGLSAAKNHLTLNPWSNRVMDDFRPQLEQSFVVLKTTFQVPVDWDVDRTLLADLVRARLAELDAA